MSQFSQKYYKNNYQLEYERPKNIKQPDEDERVWTFWRVWGLFEYLVLFLLACIIVLLFVFCWRTTSVKNVGYSIVHPKSIAQRSEIAHTSSLQESSFPKRVLPASLMDEGVLTMQEYLYFADDVNGFYPDFFDKKSRKSIAGARCKDGSCELTPEELSTPYVAAYVQWLGEQNGKKYTFSVKNNRYYITKEE